MKIPACFRLPSERTVTELALALALLHLGAALWGIVWQADIIAYQREIIRYLAPWLRP